MFQKGVLVGVVLKRPAAGAPARAAAGRSRRPATQAAAFRPVWFLPGACRRSRGAAGRGTDWHGPSV